MIITTRMMSLFRSCINRLPLSQDLKSAGANVIWILLGQAVIFGISSVVGVWVVRSLGPSQFGDLSVALSLTVLFSPLSTLGLDMVVLRELALRPKDHPSLLGAAIILRSIGSVAGLILIGLVSVLLQIASSTSLALILIVACSLLPQPFYIIEAWFTAQLRSKVGVVAKIGGSLGASLFRVCLILLGASTVWYACTPLLEAAMIGALMIVFYKLAIHPSRICWATRRDELIFLARQSLPVFLATLCWVFYKRFDQVFMNQLLGPATVGIYAAPVQLVDLLQFVPIAAAASVLPVLLKLRNNNRGLYELRVQQLYTIVTWGALVIVASLIFGSSLWIHLLFGPTFQDSVGILVIIAWNVLFMFQSAIQMQWCYAEQLHRYFPLLFGLAACVNLVANGFLVPTYGPLGAAFASVVTQVVLVYAAPALFPPTRPCALHAVRAILAPVLYLGRMVYSWKLSSKGPHNPNLDQQDHVASGDTTEGTPKIGGDFPNPPNET